MRFVALFAVCTLLAVAPGLSQSEWLPPDVAEGAAHQMIERLNQAGIALPNSKEDQLERSRTLIGKLVTQVESLGLEGVVANAPALEKIELPPMNSPIIRAIAIYGACSMPLEPDLVDTAAEKSVVVLGEMSVAVVSAFLRHQYIAAGGTEQQLADALGSDAMNRLFYEIQATEDTRNYLATECGPAFETLWKN